MEKGNGENGVSLVTSAYGILHSNILNENNILLDKVPMRTNLVRRDILLDSIICPLCQQYEAFFQHLFL